MNTSNTSVSELFPLVLGYFTSSFSHIRDHFRTWVKLCIPYLVSLVVLYGLTAIVGVLTGIAVATNPGLMDNSSPQALAASGASVTSFALVGVLGILLFIVIALFVPVSLYNYFAIIRFCIRSHRENETSQLGFAELFAWDNRFWGYLGLLLILLLLAIPVTIAGVIGLIFFVLPGVAIFTLASSYSVCVMFQYLESPEVDISQALSRGYRMVRENIPRWLILGLYLFIGYIVYYVVMLIPSILTALTPEPINSLSNLMIQVVALAVSIYVLVLNYHCYRGIATEQTP